MAPEMIKGQRYMGEACDMFSLGVTAFVLATAMLPWKENCACEEDPYFKLLSTNQEMAFWDH